MTTRDRREGKTDMLPFSRKKYGARDITRNWCSLLCPLPILYGSLLGLIGGYQGLLQLKSTKPTALTPCLPPFSNQASREFLPYTIQDGELSTLRWTSFHRLSIRLALYLTFSFFLYLVVLFFGPLTFEELSKRELSNYVYSSFYYYALATFYLTSTVSRVRCLPLPREWL